MAIIKVEPNKPLTVSLKYASAKEKQGRYGVQFLYTLENGDALFVPPIAHHEIQALHAGPGEPFTLTKSIGEGNQAVWKVERIVPSAPVESGLPKRPVSQNHPTSNGIAQPSGKPSGTNHPVPQSNHIAPKSTTNSKAPVTVMPAAAPTLATPQSRTLVRQLIATIDAVKVARDYAKQQGVDFEPTSRDICALAITGGIQVFKEGVYS